MCRSGFHDAEAGSTGQAKRHHRHWRRQVDDPIRDDVYHVWNNLCPGHGVRGHNTRWQEGHGKWLDPIYRLSGRLGNSPPVFDTLVWGDPSEFCNSDYGERTGIIGLFDGEWMLAIRLIVLIQYWSFTDGIVISILYFAFMRKCCDKTVQMLYISFCCLCKFTIAWLITIPLGPKPIKVFEICKYITITSLLITYLHIIVYLFILLNWSLYWATTAHQVLEEYNGLPQAQTSNRATQNY